MNQQDDNTYFGYHVVCLIDVLGQKQKLARWATLPQGGNITPEFIQALKETVGAVMAFRKGFMDFFALASQCTMPERLAASSKEFQERYQRFKECTVKVERFSDTFVFSSQISNTYGDASIAPMFRLLSACCTAMIWSLAGKTPVRGAITVGAGAELEDGSFYGPALAEAHHLESEVAGYPRVVVSPTALDFLAPGQVYSAEPTIARIMAKLADTCRSMIYQDTDGHWIVDFLGKGMRELHAPGKEFLIAAKMANDFAKIAYDFVRSEEARFQAAEQAELAQRYGRLKQYMESRLCIWGVNPDV